MPQSVLKIVRYNRKENSPRTAPKMEDCSNVVFGGIQEGVTSVGRSRVTVHCEIRSLNKGYFHLRMLFRPDIQDIY